MPESLYRSLLIDHLPRWLEMIVVLQPDSAAMAYLPILGLVVLATYYIISSLRSWLQFRHIPGPLLNKFSYLGLIRASTSGRDFERYTALNREYGSLVQIAPGTLMTDDPGTIRRMSAARSEYTRSPWYRAMKFNPTGDTLFTLTDTAAHDRLKGKMAAGYAGRENLELEAGVDSLMAQWVDLLRAKYLSTDKEMRPLDFARSTQYFTLDAITQISYGEAFGYLSEVDVHDYISLSTSATPFLKLCGEVPYLQNIFFSDFMLGLAAPKDTDGKGMGKLLGVARDKVAERFGPYAKVKQDMLGTFVRKGVSQRECEMEVPFQIFAGSDTSATVIRTTMLYIMTCPGVYLRLVDEINQGIRQGAISSPITNEQAKAMPYLQAVIYEGLRMNAPFTGLLAKQVPPGGDTINGLFVPGGTRIAHNSWSVVRSEAVFGPDANFFRPERFLAGDLAQRHELRNVVELAFGYGRWRCAGQAIALMELNKVFVELLRNFDFQLLDPTRPWKSLNYNIFMQSEMWVRVTEKRPRLV